MAGTQTNTDRGVVTRTRIYETIRDLTEREGRPPSQVEICAAAGVSVGSLLHHLPLLVGEGLIVRKPGPRGIVLVQGRSHANGAQP